MLIAIYLEMRKRTFEQIREVGYVVSHNENELIYVVVGDSIDWDFVSFTIRSIEIAISNR